MTRAPTADLARRLGKAVVNSPLFKAAIAGNDPNVGRLLAVVGRVMGTDSPETDVTKTKCLQAVSGTRGKINAPCIFCGCGRVHVKILVGFIRKYFGKARELTQLGANRKRERGRHTGQRGAVCKRVASQDGMTWHDMGRVIYWLAL